MQALRPYQTAALDNLRAALATSRRQILCAPTGAGKTTIAAAMIHGAVSRGLSVLAVAHRRELITQLRDRLADHGVESGLILSGEPRMYGRPVQVASIQTLIRHAFPPAQLVVIDEAHHAAAESYQRLFTHYPEAWFVGLTATPWRLDGKGLGGIFDGVILASSPRELIDAGYLVPYGGFKYRAPDMHGVGTVGGDYERRGLTVACSESVVVGSIVDEWVKHARELRTILFAASLQHAETLAWHFRNRGVNAETIDYTMGVREREAVLARVRSGETRIIANVGLLGEGVDVPALECCVLARPTKSLALYLQMVGRVMRPSPGKTVARIHDHGGCIDRHGLPDDDRDYSLTTSRRKNEAKLTPLSTCPACFAIFAAASVCPMCGYTRPKVVREAGKNIDGVAVDIRAPKSEMDAFKAELVKTALARGYKPGWLVHQWTERYPEAPLPWGAYRQIKKARAI